MKRLFKTLAAVAALSLLPSLGQAQLTPGHLFVYRVGTGAAALGTTATAVFVDEYTLAGVLVQSLAMPTAPSGLQGSLTASGTAVTDGFLTVSGNGQYLMLSGYDTAVGTTGNVVSNANPRTVGRIALDGSIDTTTRLTNTGNANFRSVASTDGIDLWVASSASGVSHTTLGASLVTPLSATVTDIRVVGIADGQLYVSSAAGSTVRLGAVGSGLPTTGGQVITNLTGLPTGTGSPYAFFFADLSPAVPGLDTVYLADNTLGVQKFSLSGGSWVARGTVGTAADAIRGLTGVVDGGTVSLFATGGANRLLALSDTSGYDGTFAGAVTTLATAGANTAFRGVAMLPVPEPATWALWLGGLALLAGVARRRRG